MSTGVSFIDILVSEATMVIAAVLFLLCLYLLIFKRKTMGSGTKALTAAVFAVTGVYIAFIVWLVIMWGS